MQTVTLLTDFGTTDYFVGAVKGTLLALTAPRTVQLVDLGHQIPPGDIEAGADLLAGAAPSFPPGTIHLAVVDPGVGSDRFEIVAEALDCLFVAPDNGLLSGIFAFDPGCRVFRVDRMDLFLDPPSSAPTATFHGRDRFAPIAAALVRGEAPSSLGPRLDNPVRLAGESARKEPSNRGDEIEGIVRHIDRFGNLITNIPAVWLSEAPNNSTRLAVGTHSTRRWANCYADLSSQEAGIIPSSLGTLEVAIRDASLAQHWRVTRGDRVKISFERPADAAPSATDSPEGNSPDVAGLEPQKGSRERDC